MNESGISILVDGTLAGLSDLLQLHRISVPYIHFDLSIQSFVKMMESYIRTMSPAATNVVFILQDELSLYFTFKIAFFFAPNRNAHVWHIFFDA